MSLFKADKQFIDFYNFDIVEEESHKIGIHSHERHEMYYLESGEVTYFLGNQIIPLTAGEIVFVPKDTMHYTNYDKTFPVHRHTVYIDEDNIDSSLLPYLSELSANNHITFPHERLHHISNMFKRFQQEEKRDYPDKYLMFSHLLAELLIIVKRYRKTNTGPEISPIQRTVQNVTVYIENNITTDLTLDFLAKKFSISPSHLSKQFKLFTGVGLNEYINLCRINKSEYYLLNTDMSVTEVAFKCGFNDSNYFTRVFKRINGITPKAFSMQK